MHLLFQLILGGIAGWLAGKVLNGRGYGVLIDILLGLVGGWLGGIVGDELGIHLGGSLGYLVTAFAGAVLLVWISRLIRKAV
ncbi:MAG: GlsB/YeaQ/YmgE family stress response membrane protein [Sediminibacterium sp.]